MKVSPTNVGASQRNEVGDLIEEIVKMNTTLGLGLQRDEFEIERTHRTGGPRPDEKQYFTGDTGEVSMVHGHCKDGERDAV